MLHLLLVFAVSLFLFICKPWRLGRRERGLPPGPPTRYIIGNATQFPRDFPHSQFKQWAQKYGDIYSLKVLNRTIVVLTSPTAIKAVLDKQGLITGNRLRTYMGERTEKGYIIFQDMDNHTWKTGRKAVHTFLTTNALKTYWPAQQVEFAQFLKDILDEPERLYTHIKRTTVSVISTLVYGKRLPKYDGTEAETFFDGMKLFNEIMDVMAHPPIDLIPPLKYMPARLAPWKDLCNRTRTLRGRLYASLFSHCERQMTSGNHSASYLENLLQNLEALDMTTHDAKLVSKMLMDAGTETSSCYIQNFILTLINYPACQKRAQEELDRVVGVDRLPTIDDLPDLPYVNAFIKEVHRFRPILPLGVPHVASQDAEYKGFKIPAGSMIFANIWGIYHDANLFDCPETFEPERYLESEFGTRTDIEVDTDGFRDNLHFGGGRRICPGAEMASRTIAVNAMNLLWAFDFTKDDSGTGGLDIDSYQKPGVELAPKPFTCNVVVRDERRATLIRDWYTQTST